MGVQIDRVEAEIIEPPATPAQPGAGAAVPIPSPHEMELVLKRLAAREARRRTE